jgi:hypothetical protein
MAHALLVDSVALVNSHKVDAARCKRLEQELRADSITG